MPQINVFSRDVNSIILKFFPHMEEYKSLRENLTSFLEIEIKSQGFYRKMKGCILETNLEVQGW